MYSNQHQHDAAWWQLKHASRNNNGMIFFRLVQYLEPDSISSSLYRTVNFTATHKHEV